MQNIGQFENRYPNGLSDEIIGNCDTRINYGTTDIKTANYFSSLVGVSTVETDSIRKSNSLEGEIEEYGQKNTTSTKRNLLNEDEILRIPASKSLITIRGHNPLLLDKIIYTSHPLSHKLKDSSILEYTPKWTINKQNKMPKKKITNKPKEETKKAKLGWDNF